MHFLSALTRMYRIRLESIQAEPCLEEKCTKEITMQLEMLTKLSPNSLTKQLLNSRSLFSSLVSLAANPYAHMCFSNNQVDFH